MRVNAAKEKKNTEQIVGVRRASEAGQLHVLSGMKYQQTCHVQAVCFLFGRRLILGYRISLT